MDAINATEKGFFDALSEPSAVDATIAEHATPNDNFPLVLLGDIDTVQPIGRSDDLDRTMRVSVLVLTQGEERKPCNVLLDQVSVALNGKSFSVDDWIITPTLEVADSRMTDDGAGYLGLAIFTVFALKNAA